MTPYYQDELVTLYHGDCREVLPKLPRMAVVTDPPYGIGFQSNGQWFKGADQIAGDQDMHVAESIMAWASFVPLVMFYSPYAPFGGWRSVLVWNKGEHVGIGGDRETCWKRDFELIGVSGNKELSGARDSAVLSFRALLPPPSGHVAEKPEALLAYLINKIDEPEVIDPCAGSGSTLAAAKRLGRKAVGIEIEERWCEYSARRLSQGSLSEMFK